MDAQGQNGLTRIPWATGGSEGSYTPPAQALITEPLSEHAIHV